MRKTVWTSVFAIGLIALFMTWPHSSSEAPRTTPQEVGDQLAPHQELKMKQSILQKDVERTAQLCLQMCSQDILRTLQAMDANDEDVMEPLQALHEKNNNHLIYLRWHAKQEEGTATPSAELGEIPAKAKEKLTPFLTAAHHAAEAGVSYESNPVNVGDKQYIVISLPAKQRHASIIAIVHPSHIHQLAVEQRKNLRIVPYPSDKRFKIQSVDADTLRDVKVDHPEENEGTSHYHIDEVVVKFKAEPTEAQWAKMKKAIGSTETRKIEQMGHTYVFHSNSMSTEQMMEYFRKYWDPQYVEPHFLYLTNSETVQTSAKDLLFPNDELFYPYQWNLPIIETIEGWEITRGNEAVKVAVIDTGVDLNHPDLAGKLDEGINFVDLEATPDDDVGHGTHVAGIIGAVVDNYEGVAGMSWYNKVIPIKVLDESGAGNTYAVAQGIIWAADQGAKVINMSLGNYAEAQFLHDAIQYAFAKDVVLIAATGNDNTETPGYPAAYPEVFAVSATDRNHRKAVFSNYGNYVDVVAPGEQIASTYYGKQYAALSGTSMASPHVAALAAMIRSINPALTNVEVMQLMRNSAMDLGTPGKDKYYGYGVIDVKKALEGALYNEPSILLWPDRLENILRQVE